MIKKYNEIKEIENPTFGITRKFAEDGIYKKTIETNKEKREVEEETEN